MSEEEEEPKGTVMTIETHLEVVALKVEMDLVPEWSNILENIGHGLGEKVAMGIEDGQVVVKVGLKPGMKPRFMAEVGKYWEMFTERRKREGRWRR